MSFQCDDEISHTNDHQIIFTHMKNKQLIYGYSIDGSGEKLLLTFTENNSEITQNWIKNNKI